MSVVPPQRLPSREARAERERGRGEGMATSTTTAAGSGAGASPSPSSCFTTAFPYTGPQHSVQKLMRAALASSCLRGTMRVWQFQEGIEGWEVRRKSHLVRLLLLKTGLLHRVCQAPALCGEYLHRRMQEMEYVSVGEAIVQGHTEMGEWLMSGRMRAFEAGMFHVPAAESRALHAPLPMLMRSACRIDWDWALQRIMQTVAESNDPVAVEMRKSGEYAAVLALACAQAGSPNSLRWAKHLAAETSEEVLSRTVERLEKVSDDSVDAVAATCSVPVAEWLWPRGEGGLRWQFDGFRTRQRRGHFEHAVKGGNWSVMEWLLQRSGVKLCPTRRLLDDAARHGSVAAMQFLVENGLGKCSAHAGNRAAATGSLSVLEWLQLEKPECVVATAVLHAARVGSVDKVHFLLDHCNLPWTPEHAAAAAEGEHLPLLEWAHRRKLALPPRLRAALRSAVPGWPVLQFLVDKVPDLQCSTEDIARACTQSVSAIRALHARFPNVLSQDRGAMALHFAAHAGRLDTVEFILSHVDDPDCTDDAFEAACGSNRLELVKLVRARFPDMPVRQSAMAHAAAVGALDVTEWLHYEHGLSPQVTATVRRGHCRTLEFFVHRCGASGPITDENALTVSSRD